MIAPPAIYSFACLSPDRQDRAHREQREQKVAVLDQEQLKRLAQVRDRADRHPRDEAEPVEESARPALWRGRGAPAYFTAWSRTKAMTRLPTRSTATARAMPAFISASLTPDTRCQARRNSIGEYHSAPRTIRVSAAAASGAKWIGISRIACIASAETIYRRLFSYSARVPRATAR